VAASKTGFVSYTSDILATHLDVVFCGLNPATSAVRAGHNFCNPSNRFWSVLDLSGFTAVRIEPKNERDLIDYSCGITAIVDRPTDRADQVLPFEFKNARHALETKIRRYAPRVVAFLGKHGFSAMTGQRGVSWGHYCAGFADTIAWILPNPSGLNRGFNLEALVRAYTELRIDLNRSGLRNLTPHVPSVSIPH
jgi:TDG/mug DNA glycosylase family protein